MRRASASPSRGASASHDAATARRAAASRSPPRASLRSGSSRKRSSPAFSARSRHRACSCGSRLAAWLRQSARTAVRSPARSPASPHDGPRVEQPELDLEVLGGGLAGLGRGAHGVVQGHAEVPHGVPEAVGERGQCLGAGLAVVQEQQVEVAARGEFRPAVAADRHQGRPAHAGLAYGPREEGAEPVIGQCGQGGTPGRPGPRLLLEEAQPGRGVAAGSRAVLAGRFGGRVLHTRHPGLPSLRARPRRARRCGP